MNEDTKKLLKEVNCGTKSAVNSFDQVKDFVKSQRLMDMIEIYSERHTDIGEECSGLLGAHGEEDKDPTTMAKAMMWFTTEIKMMTDRDDSRIAELLADGCNMGIKSLYRYKHQYENADREAVHLADRLISLEMDLYKKLMPFM